MNDVAPRTMESRGGYGRRKTEKRGGRKRLPCGQTTKSGGSGDHGRGTNAALGNRRIGFSERPVKPQLEAFPIICCETGVYRFTGVMVGSEISGQVFDDSQQNSLRGVVGTGSLSLSVLPFIRTVRRPFYRAKSPYSFPQRASAYQSISCATTHQSILFAFPARIPILLLCFLTRKHTSIHLVCFSACQPIHLLCPRRASAYQSILCPRRAST